jgi:outer membrane protein OmpA-like peptidoglycan-associated protein
MAVHHVSSAVVLGFLLVCGIAIQGHCLAQQNPEAGAAESKADAVGCEHESIFPKLVSAELVTCHSADSAEVTMPLKPDAQGLAQEKVVRGVYEYREYQITQADQQEHVFENLIQLVPMAGFTPQYSVASSTITARQGDIWVLINVTGEFYNVSIVRMKEEPWVPPFKNEEEISREMEANQRVAIYGLAFSTNSKAAYEENNKILGEVLKYLNQNPGLSVIVEGHKQSQNGNAEGDLEITRKRADAVVEWLETHGIAKGRLQSKALGRTQPITENETPRQIHQNERIELVRVGGSLISK